MHGYQAHDLLWADASTAAPPWASDQWLRQAPLVVRRAVTAPGRIAVGLRGLLRSERHAGEIEAASVLRCMTPEMLAGAPFDGEACAALAALHTVAPLLDATGWAWGPTGGVGFALASGLPVLRADSDLDLVLRLPAPPDAVQMDALRDIAAAVAGCRLDLQIDTGHGGFAWAEWAAGRPKILLKTNGGPLLTATPWESA
ncbi:malonate decarboxylase holo-ACP synthase [Janthinobacterium psychrotolerans]|uniref:Phosphoribosyl-dephospho-CoA transferase n=1 Tax=Janthinobacterium psychrotolerans TaxID=1747903 RepID=A0A1A7BWJ2_9BURK|nr:malonate decarboxylase holo-ACP synthase [Janthinobacterium psychrotolerans]OBV37877.1 phosphoribosyl-dephospho-CoA transferase [Janthinobacterium psychrotolerans]